MDENQKAVQVFNKYAQQYAEKFMDVNLFTAGLNLFCQELKNPQAYILDIACGPGNMAHYLLTQNPHFQVLGIDLAPHMLELAQQNNPSAQFKQMDARHIGSLHKKFHGIVAAFCLPYLNKAEALQLIADAAQLLHPGGILYLSTMEDDYTQSRYHTGSNGDEIFIYYHEGAYLTEALMQQGFTLLHTERIANVMGKDIQTTDLILIARR